MKKTNKKTSSIIHYPQWIEESKVKNLWGYYYEPSNEYNITSVDKNPKTDNAIKIVEIAKSKKKAKPGIAGLTAFYTDNELHFYQNGRKSFLAPYQLDMDVFSEDTGIRESDDTLHSCVTISGLGSAGSATALQLAESGVQKFFLIDNDILGYHNIFLHQCGVSDVGKLKVDAVKERILKINPTVEVNTFVGKIEDVPQNTFNKFIGENSIIVGCSDNQEGDIYANYISQIYKIPLVAIGFTEETATGEIFYSIPGETPCYECLFDSGAPSSSKEPSTNRRFYTDETDLKDISFSPGVSVDISFVTDIGIKFILALLSREEDLYEPCILDHLYQYTLVCNTNNEKRENREELSEKEVKILSHPLQITHSLKTNYSNSCGFCKMGGDQDTNAKFNESEEITNTINNNIKKPLRLIFFIRNILTSKSVKNPPIHLKHILNHQDLRSST